MSYFKTKYQKQSAVITSIIGIILLLLLFMLGLRYLDPPLEYGMEVNFGTTNVGKGKVQPTEPLKPATRQEEVKEEVQEEVQEEVEEEVVEEATTEEAAEAPSEEVVTAESAEAIAMKKKAEAERKAKEAAEAKKRAEEEAERKRKAAQKAAEEKKRKEQEAKKAKLDALMGGIGKSDGTADGGEGDDNEAGDKGQPDGNPYANSYYGSPGPGGGGGQGYGLAGRGRPTREAFKQDCNEYGRVVVKIIVNRQGRVISAEPGVRGTNNTASCLMGPAKRTALSHKWPADSKAPERQVGFVVVNFKASE